MPSTPNSCSVMRAIGGGAVDIEIGDSIRALIPTLQNQAPVIHAMVVVEMREERVRDIDRTMAALKQSVMRTGSVGPDDHIVADLDEIAGTLTIQRRRWRAGAEQRDADRSRRCRLIIRGARDCD